MKRNKTLDDYCGKAIAKMILSGKLYTPEMVDEDLKQNLDLWAKIMTVAINKSLKVGKKRILEQVQPEIDRLLEDYYRRVDEDNGDRTHAISVVERMYDQIMEEHA